jgi:flagellar biosynthetic protein FliR
VIDLTPLVRIGLLLVRPGTLILGTPPFGGLHAPAPVKIGLTVLVAVALLPIAAVPDIDGPAALATAVAREFAIGLALAMAIRALVAAAEFAGHLAGFQMGLSYSAIVDPQSGVRNNLLASLYGNTAVVVFLVSNAHHALLRALGDSYASLPIGAGHVGGALPQATAALLGMTVAFAARLAAPIVLVLIVAELALALVARSAPALNLLAVGAPVRIIAGLVVLGLVLPAAVAALSGMGPGALQAGVGAAQAFR